MSKIKGKTYEEIYGSEQAKIQREKRRTGNKGKHDYLHTEEIRKKISNTLKKKYKSGEIVHVTGLTGRIPWNKGLTKETDLRLKHISKLNMGNKNCLGRKISQETKNKISESNKKSWWSQYCKSPTGREWARERRLKQVFPVQDTKIEVAMQNELTKNGINFFKHKIIDNIYHKYQCDIFIEPNIVIECDGNYWHNYPNLRRIDKMRTTEMLNNGYVVLRFWESDIKKNIDSCINQIKHVIK